MVMTLEKRNELCQGFQDACMTILLSKGKDYSPNGIAFEDLKNTAEEIGVEPVQVLWVHLKKQYTAVKSYVKKGQVASEPIEERLKDLSNMCTLMYVLLQEQNAS